MTITVFIRYQIDPFKRAAFEAYAQRWMTIIPRCGGKLLGYWMPHEGTNTIAFGLISFESLAAYEAYRARLRADQEGAANFMTAEEGRFILAEERGVVAAVGHSGNAVVAPLEGSESLGKIIQLRFDVFHHSRIGHIQRVFEDPIRMSHSQLGMRIDGVQERIDELTHVSFSQILTHYFEVRAAPITGVVPPSPIAVVDVRAHFAHEIRHAKYFAKGRIAISISANPGVARILPRGSVPPPTQHAYGGKPTGARVVP